MNTPWLDIIGIGEDGVDGLSAAARQALENADIILGGDRHHKLAPNIKAKRLKWPSPFDAMIDEIMSHKGEAIVVLVTGDPLWYSVGARITKAIPADEIRFHPQLSAFQWAACRMGWSLADCDTLTIHGRADSQLVPHMAPGNSLLILTQNADSPAQVANLLSKHGFGQSPMTVWAALGGDREQQFTGIAETWDQTVPDFHTLAVECVADHDATWYPRTAGLPDEAFVHDGQLTKQAVRAVTLSALAPYPDALLWDVGAGCGSVGIEWMRLARGARAIAIEPQEARQEFIEQNCRALGTEKLVLERGTAPDALDHLPEPDAIFIGGGMNDDQVFETCWDRLREGGRLVANCVTLEGISRLIECQERLGGHLSQITIADMQKIGRFRGFKPAMTVTQWCVQKPGSVQKSGGNHG